MEKDTPMFEISPSWQAVLEEELKLPYAVQLAAYVEKERHNETPVYPAPELVFNAFRLTSFQEVRVVIVGQDPYHGPGQAHGLSFSVPKGVPIPPSLQNIYKELAQDVGITMPAHGCLTRWAEQGVLLLNATLTVRQGEPLSHHKRGWERFTDAVIHALCQRQDPLIFLLWGKSAQEKCRFVSAPHSILAAPHPSPFSAHQGFFGCRHFSQTNSLLEKRGSPPIQWQV